jgi:hypothetical protein
MTCERCGKYGELYYTCCGDPCDGTAGASCTHHDGERICEACWQRALEDGELS